MNEFRPRAGGYRDLVTFVGDRPGHDTRYAIDSAKIERELGWRPAERFETGLRKTVRWYLDNPVWWGAIRSGGYRGERLGEYARGCASGTNVPGPVHPRSPPSGAKKRS